MADFTKAFDERKDSYLAHYGTPGMRWGVRNEYQPVGQQESYSEEETQSMKQTADKVKQASPEDVKEKRKNIGRGPTVPNSTDSNLFEFRIIYSSHYSGCKFLEKYKRKHYAITNDIS